MKKLVKRLLDKSQHTFILSLETYNRLTTPCRIEAFSILFINAWELLLKAKILNDGNYSIFYKKERNKPRKSISFSDCLNKIFNEKDPIRKNLGEIQNLRDSSIHLIVDEIDKIYVGLFQAGVLNYTNCLNRWFSINLNEKINPAMLSIMFDFSPLNFIKIKNKYGKEVMDFLEDKQKKILKESKKINDSKYKLEINYKIALVKNPKKADIVLAKGGGGKGILIEVTKDIGKTHPFRSTEIIAEVNKIIAGRKITSYDVQAIVYSEKIKKKPEFYYFIPKLTPRLYSAKFIKFIINKIKNSKNYLNKARGHYKKYLDKRRIQRRKERLS